MTAILLDTHVLLWWLQGGSKLSASARTTMQNHGQVLVSAVSAWEIAIKYKAGRLDVPGALINRFQSAIEEEHFVELPISIRHAVQAGLLAGSHRDPFDRMLIAQAQVEDIPVISTDKCFDEFKVPRVW